MAGAGRTTLAGVAIGIGGVVLGLIVSLFTAGAGLFSDGPGPLGRFYVVAIGAGLLFLLGLVGGFAAPVHWRTWGVALGVPVIPVVLLFGEFGGRSDWIGWVLLGVSFVLSFVAASLFGSWMGAAVKKRPRV